MIGEAAIVLIEVMVGLPKEAMMGADILAHMGGRERALIMAVVVAVAEAHIEESVQVPIMVRDVAQLVVEGKETLSMEVVVIQVPERRGTLITAVDIAQAPEKRG